MAKDLGEGCQRPLFVLHLPEAMMTEGKPSRVTHTSERKGTRGTRFT